MNKQELIETGRKVIQTEISGLLQLGEGLGEDFVSVVEKILSSSGKILIAGMGKSGHVAKKMASTFCSTGTAAYFIHPSECSHGDLGIVGKDDIVLLLSNSGETRELSDIIYYTRRYSIFTIGISSNKNSTLMKSTDLQLSIPSMKEACSLGLAPTTSTTVTMALGDAVAVSVMKLKKFTKDSFHMFHPGGKLGAKLLKVEALMHTKDKLPLVVSGSKMSSALLVMSQKSFGVVGIVDRQKKLIGVITDGDLRRNIDNILDKNTDIVMTRSPVTIDLDSLACDAIVLLNKHNITSLFVVDSKFSRDVPIGIIHILDLIKAGL